MWLVFDVDGTLIDVGKSYDTAVKLTVEYILGEFGRPSEVGIEEIRELRRNGAFGDDFKLSEAIIRARLGGNVQLDPGYVERVFNTFYLGELYEERLFEFSGLWKLERPLVDVKLLEEAEKRFKLGIVTGRSRLEMELAEKILGFKFRRVITREEGLKPNPDLLHKLVKGEKGVYIGDTAGDELMVNNYRKKYGDFGFIMVGRDVKDINEAVEALIEGYSSAL